MCILYIYIYLSLSQNMVLIHIHVLFDPMGSDFAPTLLGGEEELMLDMVVPKRDRIQEAGLFPWMLDVSEVAQAVPNPPSQSSIH